MHLPKVLTVCSDPDLHSTLEGVATEWNLEVMQVSTPAEALARLDDRYLTLVFCQGRPSNPAVRALLEAASSRKPAVRLVALVDNEQDYHDALFMGAFDAIPLPIRRTDIQWMMIHALRTRGDIARAAVS